MNKILQINVTANWGSTGRIAENIGLAAQKAGFESWIAWGRYANPSQSHLIRIGSRLDYMEHGLESRIFDNHGLASRSASRLLIRQMEEIQPDIIHLHNIHGYFLNYPLLFEYLKKSGVPVVWTLHDCWSFTGHCAYFDRCGCDRWKTGCHHCPQKKTYPASYVFDRSKRNYEEKKFFFTSLKNLHVVSVSRWLDNLVGESFLKDQHHVCIYNGINTETFSPAPDRTAVRHELQIADEDTMLLGVASIWDERKGLKDFIELSKRVTPAQKIVLVGLSDKQKAELPANILGISRTESVKQLAELYSAADLFLNLTYEDNYPTTNLESISCGTPCLTYRTGGSVESISEKTGFVVGKGDLDSVLKIVSFLTPEGRKHSAALCREYALKHFRQEDRFQEYINLYQEIL